MKEKKYKNLNYYVMNRIVSCRKFQINISKEKKLGYYEREGLLYVYIFVIFIMYFYNGLVVCCRIMNE